MDGASKITRPAPISLPTNTGAQPRAVGSVMMSTKTAAGRSALEDLRQSGAMKALFPRPDTAALQAIVINTAGGVTGGDNFTLTARAGENSHLSLTTQAAERAYQAQPEQIASVSNRLFASRGARIDWLPQETILYESCAMRRQMSVELDEGASLLLVEPLVFGRAAMGEVLRHGSFSDRIDIRRKGQPLYLDAMTLQGDIAGHLASSGVAAGAGALATVVYVAADAERHLAPVRASLPEMAGVSLIQSDLLVARILAPDSFALRQSLIPIPKHLTNDALPRSWIT